MNKKFTKLMAALALLLFIAPPLVGWGQTKITDYNNIVSGKTYYIGATTSSTDYYLSVVHNSASSSTSVAGTAVTSQDDATTFLFEGSGTSWTIKFDNGYYLSLRTTKDNGKVLVVEDAATFTASNQSSKIRLTIGSYSVQKNNTGTQFGSYANTQTDIWLMEASSSSSYTVTYNGNGNTSGSAPVDSNSPYDSGATVTVLDNTGGLAKTHYTFGGWNTAADGSGTNYAAGNEFTISANTTLYAKWIANTHDITMPSSNTYGSYTASATSSVAYGTTVTLTYTPATGYESYVATWSVNGTPILSNTFEMPDIDVTVTVAVTPAPEWRLADLASLTSSDIFVIVGTKSTTNYAMTNGNGTTSAPSAPTVTIANNKITSEVADNMKWNISGNASGYTFYPNGSTTTWLYCTNSNDGVRVGTNESKTFTIDGGYLKHGGTSRYVGVYTTNPDWRCYTSSTGNIADETFTFYKRVVPSSVATPVLSVASGTYGANQSVSITCATDGAVIYYTTNGTTPTSSSTAYSSAISITQSTTLKAVAYKNGEPSEEATATYTLLCANPSFSAAEGTYTTNQSVSITCATDGATIYYTTNGDMPTSSSTAYSSAISITQNTALKAIAIKSGWNSSDVISATYTLKCATPSFSPADGAYTTAQNVSISSATADVAIYYTLDGNTPTSSSSLYSSAITINATKTLKAIATKSNWENSDVATAEYLIASAQNLTVNAAHHASLTVKANGAVIDAVEGVYPIPYGATVTLEGEEESGYGLSGWTSAQVTVTDNVFTMPNEAVTVTAAYDEVWYATFMVNGSLLETKNVVKGNAIGTLPTPESGIPAGFAFKGWYNGDYTMSNTPPTYITTAFVPTDDVTLKAVLAVEEIVAGEETNLEITINNFTEITTSYTTEYTHNYTSPTVTVEAYGVYNNSNGIQMNSGKGTYIKNTTPMPGYITKFVLTWTASGKNSPTMYANANSEASTSSTNLGKQSSSVTEQTINIADPSEKDYKYFYFDGTTVTGACYLSSFKIYYRPSTINYYSYCTLITEVASNTIRTDAIPTNELVVVRNNATLTLNANNNGTAANLIIEDGGQLIHTAAVNATLQKGITAYHTGEGYTGEGNTDGWYTIASPVNNAPVSIATVGTTYDLYSFNESAGQWYNQKAHTGTFTAFEEGKGYLYANSANQTLSFAGSMKATNATVTVPMSYAGTIDAIKGFNLVGNPFTRNLTNSDIIKIGDNELTTDLTTYYYVAGGKEILSTTRAEREIKPGEGFLVQVAGAGQNLVFDYASKGETATKPAYIRIEAGNESFMDRAYVQIGQGNTLRKMTINDNVAHVCVLHNGNDYAAATIEATEGEMPVNFRANENGTYTLTVNAENVEMNYLHLIDNLTGTDTDLLSTPAYTFNARTSDYESRFRLVFSANSAAEDESETFAFVSDGNIIIAGEGTLQVIDVMGRVVRTEDAKHTVSTANMPAGVYVLRLVNGNNVKTQKMVVR